MSTPLTVAWLRGVPLEIPATRYPDAQVQQILNSLEENLVESVESLRLAAHDIGGAPNYDGSPIINAAFPNNIPGATALRQKLKAWATQPPAQQVGISPVELLDKNFISGVEEKLIKGEFATHPGYQVLFENLTKSMALSPLDKQFFNVGAATGQLGVGKTTSVYKAAKAVVQVDPSKRKYAYLSLEKLLAHVDSEWQGGDLRTNKALATTALSLAVCAGLGLNPALLPKTRNEALFEPVASKVASWGVTDLVLHIDEYQRDHKLTANIIRGCRETIVSGISGAPLRVFPILSGLHALTERIEMDGSGWIVMEVPIMPFETEDQGMRDVFLKLGGLDINWWNAKQELRDLYSECGGIPRHVVLLTDSIKHYYKSFFSNQANFGRTAAAKLFSDASTRLQVEGLSWNRLHELVGCSNKSEPDVAKHGSVELVTKPVIRKLCLAVLLGRNIQVQDIIYGDTTYRRCVDNGLFIALPTATKQDATPRTPVKASTSASSDPPPSPTPVTSNARLFAEDSAVAARLKSASQGLVVPYMSMMSLSALCGLMPGEIIPVELVNPFDPGFEAFEVAAIVKLYAHVQWARLHNEQFINVGNLRPGSIMVTANEGDEVEIEVPQNNFWVDRDASVETTLPGGLFRLTKLNYPGLDAVMIANGRCKSSGTDWKPCRVKHGVQAKSGDVDCDTDINANEVQDVTMKVVDKLEAFGGKQDEDVLIVDLVSDRNAQPTGYSVREVLPDPKRARFAAFTTRDSAELALGPALSRRKRLRKGQ